MQALCVYVCTYTHAQAINTAHAYRHSPHINRLPPLSPSYSHSSYTHYHINDYHEPQPHPYLRCMVTRTGPNNLHLYEFTQNCTHVYIHTSCKYPHPPYPHSPPTHRLYTKLPTYLPFHLPLTLANYLPTHSPRYLFIYLPIYIFMYALTPPPIYTVAYLLAYFARIYGYSYICVWMSFLPHYVSLLPLPQVRILWLNHHCLPGSMAARRRAPVSLPLCHTRERMCRYPNSGHHDLYPRDSALAPARLGHVWRTSASRYAWGCGPACSCAHWPTGYPTHPRLAPPAQKTHPRGDHSPTCSTYYPPEPGIPAAAV